MKTKRRRRRRRMFGQIDPRSCVSLSSGTIVLVRCSFRPSSFRFFLFCFPCFLPSIHSLILSFFLLSCFYFFFFSSIHSLILPFFLKSCFYFFLTSFHPFTNSYLRLSIFVLFLPYLCPSIHEFYHPFTNSSLLSSTLLPFFLPVLICFFSSMLRFSLLPSTRLLLYPIFPLPRHTS